MGDQRSDNILREILEDRKTLTGFLDAIFGFMSRNTDFYHIQNTKDDRYGFPRGVKEEILMSCMQKYEHIINQSELIRDGAEYPSIVADEIEILAEESNEHYNKNQQQNFTQNAEVPKNCSSVTTKFEESDYKNGSLFENYCWSQTVKDVELCVILPKEVKLAKHILIKLKSNHIIVKALLPKERILIDGETWDKYRHKDVIWSISESKLIITFDKIKECWWDKLFANETSTNLKSLDTEYKFKDYSPDVQNEVEKLHIKERIRNDDLRASTLNESEQMARLRQAWNIDGSPFKGKPFDHSVIQFN